MRISDWSSDVCSSDLEHTGRPNLTGTYNLVPEAVNIETIRAYLPSFKRLGLLYNSDEKNSVLKRDELAALTDELGFQLIAREIPLGVDGEPRAEQIAPQLRSAEHTSELQSLMRISSAVLCLKQKKH